MRRDRFPPAAYLALAASAVGVLAGPLGGAVSWVQSALFAVVAIAAWNLLPSEPATGVDSLTGVPTRRAFLDDAEACIRAMHRAPSAVTLVYIDVDGLKQLNARLGHATGDAVLHSVAGSLLQQVRARDTVARFGSDEFAVLLSGIRVEDVKPVVERLRERLRVEMRAQGWTVTFSVDAITFRTPPKDTTAMLARIEDLMKELRVTGQDRLLHRVEGETVLAAARS